MILENDTREAFGLIALLGWDFLEGLAELDKATNETLSEYIRILSVEEKNEPEWVKSNSIAGIRKANAILEKRNKENK
jgi:hypothetical protein